MGRNSVLVLCYHRVNILKIDTNLLAISPEHFRQHMKYLKENYMIARFEDDWRQLDEQAVVVTFDDGYLDNFQNALPILEELDIPATVFITTGIIGKNRELWWDELENVLLDGNIFPSKFHLEDDRFDCVWDTHSYEMRMNCYNAIHYLMKNFIDVKKREQWMLQLWNWRGKEPQVRCKNLTVSKEICKELGKSKLISIGAHTVSHPSLKSLDTDAQRTEIKESLENISEIINRRVNIFSYPFGMKDIDYSSETVKICKELGIKKAAAAYGGVWKTEMDDYTIPRNGIRNMDLNEFKVRIKKIWENYK